MAAFDQAGDWRMVLGLAASTGMSTEERIALARRQAGMSNSI